jgi:hypothetical protein
MHKNVFGGYRQAYAGGQTLFWKEGGQRESQEVADALPIVPVEKSSGVSCRNQHPFSRPKKLD